MSDGGVPVKDFLKARRDRALGSILGYMERSIYESLSLSDQRQVRKVVIDALNSYHDSVLDLLKSETGERNEEVLSLLSRLHSDVSRLVDADS